MVIYTIKEKEKKREEEMIAHGVDHLPINHTHPVLFCFVFLKIESMFKCNLANGEKLIAECEKRNSRMGFY